MNLDKENRETSAVHNDSPFVKDRAGDPVSSPSAITAFVSDLHGEEGRYSALSEFMKRERPGTIILGGDLFPNCTDRETAIGKQKEFIEGCFRNFLEIAAAHATRVLLVFGNMDFSVVLNPVLALCRSGLAQSIHFASAQLGEGFKVAGYPATPPSPFKLKDFEKRDLSSHEIPAGAETALISTDGGIIELPAAEILGAGRSMEEDLDYLLDGISLPFVLVTHCPPSDTCLDMIGSGCHVGSSAVRKAIEKYSPALSLHGHIHESPEVSGSRTDTIGKTLCVNPGKRADCLCVASFDSADPTGSLKFTELPLK